MFNRELNSRMMSAEGDINVINQILREFRKKILNLEQRVAGKLFPQNPLPEPLTYKFVFTFTDHDTSVNGGMFSHPSGLEQAVAWVNERGGRNLVIRDETVYMTVNRIEE